MHLCDRDGWGSGRWGERVTHLGKPPLGKDSLQGGHCRLAGERARGNSIWLMSPQCSRRGPCRCLPWGEDRGTRRAPAPLWPLRLGSPLPAPLKERETQWGPTSGAQQQQPPLCRRRRIAANHMKEAWMMSRVYFNVIYCQFLKLAFGKVLLRNEITAI